MKIRIILLSVIALISIVILVLPTATLTGLISQQENTDDSEYIYSYTKAICDDENFCQDYEVVCKGNETIEKTPITGAFIQHENNWQDPRDENVIEVDCE